MRAAVASKNIQDWLDELSGWDWPSESSSAGFESPQAKRRKLSDAQHNAAETRSQGNGDELWMGSIRATEVALYDQRVDAIQRELEELDVEEIKNHVLHHHIFPLSRPGTPISDTNSVGTSSIGFNRMDDLTAVITAVVIQALPNLSRLMRLVNTWSVRLLVLKRVPTLLACLGDAEVAIQAGWDAMDVSKASNADTVNQDERDTTLTRADFQVMKAIVEKKIGRAGQIMDYMLDSLDGKDDTIPDDWIDRMDRAEQGYSEWVATCERKIREAEWRKLIQAKPILLPPAAAQAPPGVRPKAHNLEDCEVPTHLRDQSEPPEIQEGADVVHSERDDHTVGSWDLLEDEDAAVSARNGPSEATDEGEPAEETDQASDTHKDNLYTSAGEGKDQMGSLDTEAQALKDATSVSILNSIEVDDGTSEFMPSSPPTLPFADEVDDNRVLPAYNHGEVSHPGPTVVGAQEGMEEGDTTIRVRGLASQLDDDDFEPPRPLTARRSVTSLRSQPSLPSLLGKGDDFKEEPDTPVAREKQVSDFDVASDIPLLMETPELPRMRNLDSEADQGEGDNASPPSSPPNPHRYSIRSLSSLNEMPTVAEDPDDDAPAPKTPRETAFLEEPEIPRDVASPSRMSVSSEDDQLQQQISEILESIPAKIRLSNQPALNHLNPPEFQLPMRAKSKTPDPGRSHSAMSSRAGTPSFLLAPAYSRNPRPRQPRSSGNSDIKLYHLSRSTGEAPIKLFIRLVGENGERVMVRVGGGWADLGEYLKEYASHHGRRSKTGADAKIEVRDLPPLLPGMAAGGAKASLMGSSPPSRPASALDSPMSPLVVRKTRKLAESGNSSENAGPGPAAKAGTVPGGLPKTPMLSKTTSDGTTPSSGASTRSRSSSRLSWTEEDSSLGMSGPRTKNIEMSEESRAWVESVKEKVRLASGERRVSDASAAGNKKGLEGGKFGEIGKVGATKRLFRKGA
jgi:hypothetical protein